MATQVARRGRPRKPQPVDFYAPAFSDKLRQALADAAQLEGLDQEIALFRVRLRELLARDDVEEIDKHHAAELLIQAVRAAEQLSDQGQSADVIEHMTAELSGILELLADTPPQEAK